MRIIILLNLALLALAGCATPGGGTPPSANDDVNSNGGGSGPPVQNDNEASSNDNGSSANDNDSVANDNDSGTNDNDDSGELPVAFRLDGVWDDNGRHVIIEQNGIEVEANYFTERFCDPEIGPVDEPTPGADSTFFDFRGTLNNGEDVLPGDTITGEVTTCRYGFDSGNNGFVLADMTLVVVDEDNMSGEYEYDEDGDGEPDRFGSFTVTRQQ